MPNSNRFPVRRLFAAVLLGLTVTACSGGDNAPNEPSNGEASAFNTIETCDNMGGRGVATGTLENTGTRTTTYQLEMDFTDYNTGQVLATGVAMLRGIEPGMIAKWTIEADGVGDAELSCSSSSISGDG